MAGPDDLGSYADQAGKVNEIMSNIGNMLKNIADYAGKAFGSDSKQNLDNMTGSANGFWSALNKIPNAVEQANNRLAKMGSRDNYIGINSEVDKLLNSFYKLESFATNQSDIFDQIGISSGSATNTVVKNFGKITEVMKGLHIPGTDIFDKIGTNFLANATEAEKLENSYTNLTSSAGDLDEIFDRNTGKLKDLTALTATYSNEVSNASLATGLEVKQSMEFANAIKQIPGAFNEMIRTGSANDQQQTSLVSTMRLMTGSGREQGEVLSALTTAYEKLSQANGEVSDSVQKGSQFFALMSTTSSQLKLRFEDVRGILDAVAEQFKDVGDNTEAATQVLARYIQALRETGLTSKASVDIIQNLIRGMSDLTVGTKAFLSLRSGGPGGLQGAFQIEQLMRQGRMDQVIQMAERSIRQQFGGRIFTQAEAASSPEAAAQFYRQRSLLQSGVFGIGKGLNDEQATRFLEALGKGNIGSAQKELKNGQDALTRVSSQGNQLQERNYTALKQGNILLERNAIAAELTAGIALRNFLGGGQGGANEGNIRRTMQLAEREGREVANTGREIRGGKIENYDTASSIIEGYHKDISRLVNTAGEFGTATKAGLQGISESVQDGINYINNFKSVVNRENAPVGPALTAPGKIIDNSINQNVGPNKGASTARYVANTSLATDKEKVVHHMIGQQREPKITLELIAPHGFQVNQKNKDNMIDINVINAQSTVPRI